MSFTQPTNFIIGLLNYKFDSSTNDVRLYSSKNERDIALTNKIEITQELVNVPFQNNINFTIKFNIHDYDNTQILKILNYNYCIITNQKTQEKIFYFINSSTQISAQIINLSLTIDHIQTYYYDTEFPLATLEQAHLNRWIPDPNNLNKLKFNNLINSPLFSNNLPNLPKYLNKRKELWNMIDSNNANDSPINKLLKDQKINWMIIYVYPKVGSDKTTLFPDALQLKNRRQGIDLGYNVLIAPIYNNNSTTAPKLYLQTQVGQSHQYIYEWNAYSISKLLTEGKNATFVANIKVTPICPFETRNWVENVDYEKYNDGIAFMFHDISNRDFYPYKFNSDGNDWSIANQLWQPNGTKFTNINSLTDLNIQQSFTIEEIINDNNVEKLEPHLLSQNIQDLRINDYSGNNFTYDIQKLGIRKNIEYSDILSPDIQKTYVRYNGEDNTLYNKDTETNLLGLVCSNDMSIPYDESQLQAFLAQNKNFFQQQQTNRDYNWWKVLLGAGLGLAAGVFTGGIGLIGAGVAAGVGAIGGGIAGAANTAIDNHKSLIQQNLMLNNLESSPEMLKNAQGNFLFADNIRNYLSFYLDYYKASDIDIKKAFWLLYLYGYPYSITDNIKNYDSTRTIFNYIKAQISIINGNLSNAIKDMFKESFAKGVRFWHQDEIEYNKSNYEKNLDKMNIFYSNDQTIIGDLPYIADIDTLYSQDNTILITKIEN